MNGQEEMILEDRRRALRSYWGLPVRKALIFVHPFERVADCFVRALEQEYPSLAVETYVGWDSLPIHFEHCVALALIDSRLLSDTQRSPEALHAIQPNLPYAVVCDDLRNVSASMPHFMTAETMRGLLPMDMKLDIWLSVIRLMLQGGDYYPPSLLKTLVAQKAAPPAVQPNPPVLHGPGRSGKGNGHWRDLTGRERQVLASVARGMPNKLVAAELGLSEHTVKIYIHNIIRKLQVHNRTEAAALFHEAMAQERRLP